MVVREPFEHGQARAAAEVVGVVPAWQGRGSGVVPRAATAAAHPAAAIEVLAECRAKPGGDQRTRVRLRIAGAQLSVAVPLAALIDGVGESVPLQPRRPAGDRVVAAGLVQVALADGADPVAGCPEPLQVGRGVRVQVIPVVAHAGAMVAQALGQAGAARSADGTVAPHPLEADPARGQPVDVRGADRHPPGAADPVPAQLVREQEQDVRPHAGPSSPDPAAAINVRPAALPARPAVGDEVYAGELSRRASGRPPSISARQTSANRLSSSIGIDSWSVWMSR